jgi:hypothetical protein
MHTFVDTHHTRFANRVRPHTLASYLASYLLVALALSLAKPLHAAPVIRQGSGVNAASLQAIVDQFRTDLGGGNNGVGGTFITGRREINWDGVPDNFATPNTFPPNFWNVNSPRGLMLNALETETGSALNQFMVSANTASGVSPRFGNINTTYPAQFQTFSSQRLFSATITPVIELTFFIPGTKIPATVHGFGAVFTDVDLPTGAARSVVRCYGADGTQLTAFAVPVQSSGLSFAGVSFNAGERIARVVIESGNAVLSASSVDGVDGSDVVVMDDFIYGEPQALEYGVTPSGGGEPFVVTTTVPPKFIAVTATGAPSGFINATLRCAPHHTYRIFSSTDMRSWHPATLSGAVAGPNQNLFNPRSPSLWSSGTHASPLSISTEGQSKLFYKAQDEVTGDVTIGETP